MRIDKNEENYVVITLSESNISELYHMNEVAKIERQHKRLSKSMPILFKQADKIRLVVQVERDIMHYPIKVGA